MDESQQGSGESPSISCTSPVLVLGLGNPILRDDGVGWRVVEKAHEQWTQRQSDQAGPTKNEPVSAFVEFDRVSLGGLALMERLVGYSRAVLVDAIQTRGGVPGTVYRLSLDDLPTLHADSAHDASLKAALELGRRLGARLPEEIVIYAVEAEDIWDFGETLSPDVAASVRTATRAVLAELEELWYRPNCCAGTRFSGA
jgi:hydrogenase maturation protease